MSILPDDTLPYGLASSPCPRCVDKPQDFTNVTQCCEDALGGHVNVYDVPVEDYFDLLVPCSTRYPKFANSVLTVFSNYSPLPGKEAQNIDALVSPRQPHPYAPVR